MNCVDMNAEAIINISFNLSKPFNKIKVIRVYNRSYLTESPRSLKLYLF